MSGRCFETCSSTLVPGKKRQREKEVLQPTPNGLDDQTFSTMIFFPLFPPSSNTVGWGQAFVAWNWGLYQIQKKINTHRTILLDNPNIRKPDVASLYLKPWYSPWISEIPTGCNNLVAPRLSLNVLEFFCHQNIFLTLRCCSLSKKFGLF